MSGTFWTLTPLRVRRGLAGRGDPLVRRAVADPGGDAAVEVESGAVLGKSLGRLRDYPRVGMLWIHPHRVMARRPMPEPMTVVSTGME